MPRLEAPVIVDADTGYGNALNVMRTVRDLQDAGAAGVFLEDQVWPKKCGHMAGQAGRADTEEHAAKIRAAVDARGERDLFVVARTDARQPLGLDEAIERCLAYRRPAPTRCSSRRRSRSTSSSGSPTRCRRRWSPT